MLLFKPLASRLMVSTHSRPKAAGRNWRCPHWVTRWFQHTAARRRLAAIPACLPLPTRFQHTAARRRLDVPLTKRAIALLVSTHSRPKAAGTLWTRHSLPPKCFNTQPPEGGWWWLRCWRGRLRRFQHTAARRRLARSSWKNCAWSRFQHTAARRRLAWRFTPRRHIATCFNTQPPEGGWGWRLNPFRPAAHVSTHSRPKAAGKASRCRSSPSACFNTQPPEGDWAGNVCTSRWNSGFQHTAARRRLVRLKGVEMQSNLFQHTAARRRLA